MEAGRAVGPVREAQVQVPIRLLEGSGELVARVEGDDLAAASAEDAFREADLATASPDLVAAFLDQVEPARRCSRSGAAGSLGRARLRAAGLRQPHVPLRPSGAGKTYALGVVLEQPDLGHGAPPRRARSERRLRGPGDVRDGIDADAAVLARYRAAGAGVRVFSTGHEPVRLTSRAAGAAKAAVSA